MRFVLFGLGAKETRLPEFRGAIGLSIFRASFFSIGDMPNPKTEFILNPWIVFHEYVPIYVPSSIQLFRYSQI